MTANPLVSIVMPLYNCERFVAEAVGSALEQDYPQKEVLVINDGSTDQSLKVLEPFADAIKVVSVPNGGPARARNLGMQIARGKYIAFLDADDVWARCKLSAQVAHMEAHPDLGACYTRWLVWQAQADGLWQRPASWSDVACAPAVTPDQSGWMYGRLLFECLLLTTTVMLRASTTKSVGEFDVDLRVGEDYDYWIRVAHEAQIDRLDFLGALYRVVPGSASRKPYAVNYEREVVTRALARFGCVSPDGQAVSEAAISQRLDTLLFQHAYMHLQSGDSKIARAGFGALLLNNPLRPRLWGLWSQALLKSINHRRGDVPA